MIFKKGRRSTSYSHIADWIQFGGWGLKGDEKTTAALVTCPQLPAFPARPDVHPLAKCFSRSELKYYIILTPSTQGHAFHQSQVLRRYAHPPLSFGFVFLSSRPGHCSWQLWEELFRQFSGEAVFRAVPFLGSCSWSEAPVLCPHLSTAPAASMPASGHGPAGLHPEPQTFPPRYGLVW